MWFYFLIAKDKSETAKCKKCSSVLKVKGGSTKGLLTHLLKVHKVNLIKKRQDDMRVQILPIENEPSCSSSNTQVKATEPLLKKQRTLPDFFTGKNDQSLDAILARMTSVDGLPF